ncbi:hypothetical protein EV401DRAFT_2000458 [Pisolithus croceorrhizus]|nr:hypothetical protein EV401DRAFT_2000458 [Pisolithus croceorrhizus]
MTTWRGEDHHSGRNISRRDYNDDANYPGGNVPASEEGSESQEHGGSGTGQAGGYVGWTARMGSQGTQPTGEGRGDRGDRCKRCGGLIPTITRGYECDCEGYEDLISSGKRLPPKVLGRGEMEKLAGKIVRDPRLEATGETRQRQVCTRRYDSGFRINLNAG